MRPLHAGLAGFSHPTLQPLYGDQPRGQWLAAYSRIFGAYELACTRLAHFDRTTAKRLVEQAPPALRLLPAAPETLVAPGTDARRALHDWHHAVEPILRSPNAGPIHMAWPGPHTPQRVRELEALLELMWARLPWSARVAVEFLHPSWFRGDALRVLEEHGAALVWSTSAGLIPRRVTAGFLYIRLTGNPWRGDEAAELAAALAARRDDGRPVHVISTRHHEPYGLAALNRFTQAVGVPLDLTAGRTPSPAAPLPGLHQTCLDGYVGVVA